MFREAILEMEIMSLIKKRNKLCEFKLFTDEDIDKINSCEEIDQIFAQSDSNQKEKEQCDLKIIKDVKKLLLMGYSINDLISKYPIIRNLANKDEELRLTLTNNH